MGFKDAAGFKVGMENAAEIGTPCWNGHTAGLWGTPEGIGAGAMISRPIFQLAADGEVEAEIAFEEDEPEA